MIVVVNGKRRRFVGASLNGKLMTEWRLGEKIMWPDPEGVARRIRVELPQEGTLDWQYWVHAVDATQDSVSQNNYMKFVCDGVDYFINGSYDGTPPYRLEGNVLTLDAYDGAAIDRLGAYLEVEAVIKQREMQLSGELVEGERTVRSDLPLLRGSKTQWRHVGWRRGGDSWWNQRLTSEPSGTVMVDEGYRKSGRTAIEPYTDVIHAPVRDTYWQALISMTGKGQMDWYKVIYPSFRKTFKLKIISIS